MEESQDEGGGAWRMIRAAWPKLEVDRIIHAPCASVWELLTDTCRWVDWGPSLRAVECSERFIRSGSRGRVLTPLGLWLPFTITEFEQGRYWHWKVSGISATGHRVEAVEPCRTLAAFEMPFVAAPYLVVCQIALMRIARIAERPDQ